MAEQANGELPDAVQEIKNDQSKALRAEKDVGEDEHPDLELVDVEPRTAARYLGEEDGVPMFQVVTSRVTGFPLGEDMTGTHPQNKVADRARKNDVSVIDRDDEDGFEPSLVPDDPIADEWATEAEA